MSVDVSPVNYSDSDTNVSNDNISSKYDFQGAGFKFKVTVAIFRKNFGIVLAPYLLMDFNITSHKC